MKNAYNEGYFFFSPEQDFNFPPFPEDAEIREWLEDPVYATDFNEGYEDAKNDFLEEGSN